jgi:signal transduction histidine kinase
MARVDGGSVEAQGQQDDQVRERFVSTLAHDLANPLMAIRGTVQVLKRRVRAGVATEEVLLSRLDNIDSACSRAIARLDELVELALLRNDQVPSIERQPVDLVDLLRQMVAHHQTGTERHDVQFETNEPSLVGQWDRARLVRVIDNLLSNAVKYAPRGGTITVRLHRHAAAAGDEAGEHAVLRVTDQGIGIPPAEIQHLFQRYRRATNVQDIPGTGVGLYAVRQIVEQHGGTVAAESEPGQGSTFIVRLPLATHQPASDLGRNDKEQVAGSK